MGGRLLLGFLVCVGLLCLSWVGLLVFWCCRFSVVCWFLVGSVAGGFGLVWLFWLVRVWLFCLD